MRVFSFRNINFTNNNYGNSSNLKYSSKQEWVRWTLEEVLAFKLLKFAEIISFREWNVWHRAAMAI
jgi:hypothetical protein